MRLLPLAALSAVAGLGPPAETAAFPGDTAADPHPIPSLPFFASGTTCDYLNDYDEFCPIDGQLSPDVVYAWQPAEPCTVNLSLCESSYDTKILVYENQADSNHLYACNDDWCEGPDYPWPYLAYLRELSLVPGNTYFFVVDGYGSQCGPYVLRIEESATCNLVCPPGGLEESEPKCVAVGADTSNAGCDADPPIFEPLPPSPDKTAVCAYTNSEDGHPDTDWFEIIPSTADTISVGVEADIATWVTVFDGASGCVDPPVLANLVTEPCEVASESILMPAGPVWIRVLPLLQWGVYCPARYVLTVDGYDGTISAVPALQSQEVGRLVVAPNPFLERVSIRGTGPRDGIAAVRIHDVRGRLVRTIHFGPLPPGVRELAWDGRDDRGTRVSPGVYFCRWQSPDGVRSARIVRAAGRGTAH